MRPEKRELHEQTAHRELTCELHGIPMVTPAAARYKRRHREKHEGPELEVGKKAVLSIDEGRDRKGYYLGVLVDWNDEATGWWTSDTELFFVVLRRSNEAVPDRVGRIVMAHWPYRRYISRINVVSWDEGYLPEAR